MCVCASCRCQGASGCVSVFVVVVAVMIDVSLCVPAYECFDRVGITAC